MSAADFFVGGGPLRQAVVATPLTRSGLSQKMRSRSGERILFSVDVSGMEDASSNAYLSACEKKVVKVLDLGMTNV